MSKRKYPIVIRWWVYSIYIPSIDSYYIGMSKRQCCERWVKNHYKTMSLNSYLDEWESMVKTVIRDGLTEKQAVKLEDKLITKYTKIGKCINQRRSGWIAKTNRNVYQKEQRDNNRKEVNRKQREYRAKKKLEQNQNQLTLFDLAS